MTTDEHADVAAPGPAVAAATSGTGRAARFAAAWRSGPLAVGSFRLLTVGQFTSTIGDYCYAIALPWFVLSSHGGTILLGTVLACYGIPRAVFIPVGGVLADKLSPRISMLAADGCRCLLLIALAVLVTRHSVSLATLGPVAALIGAGEGIFVPASYAIMPSLIDTGQLAAGNAVFTAAQQAASLLGPVVGGALVALAGPAPAFAVDAASFGVSAATLALIPRRLAADRGGAGPGTSGPNAGADTAGTARGGVLALLRRTRVLQIMLIVIVAANLASGGLSEVALPSLAHDRFGASGYGTLLACFAIGSIAGTLAGARSGSIRRPVPFVSAVFLVMCAAMAAVPFAGGLAGAAAAMAIYGASNGLGNVIVITRLQIWAPPEMLGRVMSLVMLCAFGSFPLSVAVTGVLVQHIGPSAFFPIAACLVAAAILAGLTQGEWRAFGAPAAAAAAAET